jgi:short-subunit dehydrogenase
MDNTGKLAVVTGASSGIGYELAVQFALNGFDLLIVAEDDGITQAAEDLRQLGTDVKAVQQDLASHEGVEAFYRVIAANGKPVEAIALNAGIGLGGKFFETEVEKEMKLIDLNVMSTVHLAKRVVQDMVKRGQGGKILITSSIAAEMPGTYSAVYNASKAFVHSFAEALHYELKEKGITVTAMQPGPTDTNFFHRAEMDNTKVGVQKKDDPAEVAKQGFDALMAGKDSVIVGSLKTRITNAANDLIPEQVKASKHAGMTKPGSAASVKKKDVA